MMSVDDLRAGLTIASASQLGHEAHALTLLALLH
jgi:hypothetical protein